MAYSVFLKPLTSDQEALNDLLSAADIDLDLRQRIHRRAIELVERIRADSAPGMMELFLGEYGLSSDEGVALMCLAEALLRVPDSETMDALIEDKIAPSAWGQHLGKSHSSLINASTWALYLTGKVLKEEDGDQSITGILHGAIKRLGEPVIRQAVTQAMKEMGRQFVLGETIEKAMERAETKQGEGFTYSYDMLGEAARTNQDARRYLLAYSDAIGELAKQSKSDDIAENPGISIKLSALHPRYETLQRERVLRELVPRVQSLAVLAKSAGIGFNIDAEEAGRLELSLDIIKQVVSDPALEGWDGFGVVVQAYGKRAPQVLDWLYALAQKHDRKFMVRLVKGAYWDTEIKLSQVECHEHFPVYTQKPSTDISYICCAQKLLGMTDRIYPQFATHNAHTVAAILEMATDKTAFEFQRLHGMGEALHDTVLRRQKTRCRIYAPVGAHKDLLAYLVRRLLENGANSSFVNQIVDESVSPELVAADPFSVLDQKNKTHTQGLLRNPQDLFAPERKNSRGWDLSDPATLNELKTDLADYSATQWTINGGTSKPIDVLNPATGEKIGTVQYASSHDAVRACEMAQPWTTTGNERAKVLRKSAELFEEHAIDIFALLMAEAGKTLLDCVGELREAVDFLRYYANCAEQKALEPAGVFTCIAPWNFPLAIFTGQVSAALAAGNAVLAKPAEATCLIAHLACKLMWQAGVPETALHYLPGPGQAIGSLLTGHVSVDGVCFTGSTATAQTINRNMAEKLAPDAVLIAETGGLNAMIVDSTALPEQAVGDIIASAFQSAGQRCSALRVLYLQSDIKEPFLKMLFGAMDELKIGNPQDLSTDVGPIINQAAADKIRAYIDQAQTKGALLHQVEVPSAGTFVPPTVLKVDGIKDLKEEIFGPVLHIATFESHELDQVIEDINSTGYGLTFGLHSRIDDRVQHVIERVEVGNIYINRNQIGAVVGSQPFGGEGLSGTGPKAGGPLYVERFTHRQLEPISATALGDRSCKNIEKDFSRVKPLPPQNKTEVSLPGPTGESNIYSTFPRGRILCLGPTLELAEQQRKRAAALGCHAIAVASDTPTDTHTRVSLEAIEELNDLDGIICWSNDVQDIRKALARRKGAIVPLITDREFEKWLSKERHICIDTTAAGGNATLLAGN